MKKTIPVLFVFISIFIIACSNEKNNLREKVSNWDPSQYTVQHGDTLYSLAWRYDLDFKAVAQWNNILSPFTIYPGQRLKMTGPIVEPAGKTYLFGSVDEQTIDVSPSSSQLPAPDYSDPDNIPQAPPVLSQNRNVMTKAPKKKNIPSPVYHHKKPVTQSRSSSRKTATTHTFTKGKIKWSWPVKGKVISTYAANNSNRKGIDIRGVSGQKIKSAGDGVVVYSGAGLISYGKLIIIKHNERFLSAYAYNKKLLVKEGTSVKKGQTIAIIGKNLNV
ncbi:MAG: peptidoglycan DD-metalloendopeptidase family protein, partial [Gammaproteobacteria bacterium]|nr:peptidoglycan DD-metalloendopeptidase family protein [Gammaproteobacteria bacterium]